MDHILRSKLFSHYHRQCAKEEPILLPPRIEQFYTPIEPEPPLRGSEKPVNETTGQDAEGSLRGHSTHHRCCGDYYCYGSGSGRTERGLRGAASIVDPLSDSASDYNGLVAQMQTGTRVNAMHDATTTDGSDDDDVNDNVHEGHGNGMYNAPYMRSRAVGSGAAMSAWRVVDDPLAFPREDGRNASAPHQTTMNDGNNSNSSSSTGTTTMALPHTLRCDEGNLAANTSYNAHQGNNTTTMSDNNGSGSAEEVNGLTTTTTEEEDKGRRRAAASGNDVNITGQCTITRHVIRRRPTRPQGELLSLCDQTPEARAALRRRRKEQLRAQLNHPEAPVIVQLAERDRRLCTVGTTLTDYVNSVVDLRTQRVQKGLTDLTQVGSVVYAALPTPYSPSESHNNNTTTSNSTSKPGKSEGEKKKTHKAGGKGKEAAVAAAEQHVHYNGLYAKYPGSRKGKKADKQQQQMLLLSRQLPLYDAASPVTFEELREHPLLLTQPRRQARWAGVVHGRVPSEEMYGQPVPYINSNDPSQVNNTTNNNSNMMTAAAQQTQQQQQQSYYGYQEYGYYYHGAQMDKARRTSASLTVQQGQAMDSSCGFQGNAAPSLPSFYTMSEAGMSLTRQNTSSTTTTTTTTNTAVMMMMMMSSGTTATNNNNNSSSNINVMSSQGMTLVPNTGKLPYTTTTTDYNNTSNSSSMPIYVGTVCTAQPETIGRPIATLAQPPVQTANNNNYTTTTTNNNDGWQPVMSQGSNPACPCSWSGLTLSNPSLSTPSPPQHLQQQQQRVEGMTTMGYTVWPPQYNDTNPSPARRPSFTPEGYAVYLSA